MTHNLQTDESDNDTEPLEPQPNPSRPLWVPVESRNSDDDESDVDNNSQVGDGSRNSGDDSPDTEVEGRGDGES